MNQKAYLDSSIHTRDADHKLYLSKYPKKRGPSPYYNDKLIINQDKSRRHRFCDPGRGFCIKGHSAVRTGTAAPSHGKNRSTTTSKLPNLKRPISSESREGNQTGTRPSQTVRGLREQTNESSNPRSENRFSNRIETRDASFMTFEPSLNYHQQIPILVDKTSNLQSGFGRDSGVPFDQGENSNSSVGGEVSAQRMVRDYPDIPDTPFRFPICLKSAKHHPPFFADVVPLKINPDQSTNINFKVELIPSMVVYNEKDGKKGEAELRESKDGAVARGKRASIDYSGDEHSDDADMIAKDGNFVSAAHQYSDGTMVNSMKCVLGTQ